MGHDNFESNVALRLDRENLSQSTSVTLDGAGIWTENFIEKTPGPKSTSISDLFYSLVINSPATSLPVDDSPHCASRRYPSVPPATHR